MLPFGLFSLICFVSFPSLTAFVADEVQSG